jgi:hypothetical protein
MKKWLPAIAVLVLVSSCAGERAPEAALERAEEQIHQLLASRPTEINDLITRCMIAQGYSDFVMRPPEVWEQPPLPGPDGRPLDPSSLEFAEMYGFGIASTVLYIYEHDVPADIFEPDDPTEAEEDEEYLFALWSEVEVDGELVAGGCNGWADQEWQRLHPKWAAVEPLTETLAEYLGEADRDPRILAYEDQLVVCLRSEGFDVSQKSDVTDSIHEMVSAVDGSAGIDQYVAELQEIRDYEIELATASRRCADTIYDENAAGTYEQVRLDYEQKFVEEHPELLEPFE